MMMNNTFTTFCLKALLLLVILFGADRLVGAAFVKMKDMGLAHNPKNMWLKTPFTVEKVDADVVVIGSSRASHHYVPQMLDDNLGMSAYNCGQDGCFFLYQNCIVNMVLDRYQPKIMIWDIQPSSFTTQGLKEYQNIRYLSPYYVNSRWANDFIDSESAKMPYRMMSRMFAYNSKALNYVFPLIFQSSSTQKGYIPLPVDGYKYPVKSTDIDTASVGMNKEYLGLLSKTLQRYREKGVTLVLCISPTFAQHKLGMGNIESAIGRVATYNGACFINSSNDAIFTENAKLFKDSDHLNDKGARLYTEKVIKKIKGE